MAYVILTAPISVGIGYVAQVPASVRVHSLASDERSPSIAPDTSVESTPSLFATAVQSICHARHAHVCPSLARHASGVGTDVGIFDGTDVGIFVGVDDGLVDGRGVGAHVGTPVGRAVGIMVGSAVGACVGSAVGHESQFTGHEVRTNVSLHP